MAALVLLAGCGAPGESAVEDTLERAWSQDTISMEVEAGMVSAEDVRGLQGARSSARAALGAVRAYAGDTVADLAGDAVGVASELVGDVGGTTVSPAARHAALMTARGWDVTNLELLKSRASDAEYVVHVRYDLSAVIAGRPQTIARDLDHVLRLASRDGNWVVVPAVRPAPPS
jgi:hypothetical protein